MKRIRVVNGQATIKTKSTKIVLPSGNSTILPFFNEYKNNTNILSIAESPFGGLKGSGAPDYMPGTVFCQMDGVYLTDTSGTNSSKILSAGKLKELSLLSVDKTAHTITEEFIVANTNLNNSASVIDNCDSTTTWNATRSTISIDSSDFKEGSGSLKATATSTDSYVSKYTTLDLSNRSFITLYVKGVSGKTISLYLSSSTDYSSYYRYDLTATGIWQRWVVPIKKYSVNIGNPDISSIVLIRVGVPTIAIGEIFWLDDIKSDISLPSYIEINTPDSLADTSAQIYSHNGTTYQLCKTCKLDSLYSDVSVTDANCTLANGYTLSSVYGTGLGRSVFTKGSSGDTKSGSLSGSTITYSNNKGTDKRIGLRVDLPPSDGGRTNINKFRVKIVTYYNSLTPNHIGSTSYIFENSENASYGLNNLIYPWIALYNPNYKFLDLLSLTCKPKGFNFKLDETGEIYEINLFPGNGLLYYRRINYQNPGLDSNSDTIPDCLSIDYQGSVAKLLKQYTFIEDWFTEIDISSSYIISNNFGIITDSLDIIPYSVSKGDSVSDENNHILPVADTITTTSGDVSLVNIKGINKIRVRDTAYTNGGECKVYDTVMLGNTNSATWVRVYTTNWIFSGDIIIDNGLFPIKLDRANNYLSALSSLISGVKYVDWTDNAVISSYSITNISPEKVTLSLVPAQNTAVTTVIEVSKGLFGYKQYSTGSASIQVDGFPFYSSFIISQNGNVWPLSLTAEMSIPVDGYWFAAINPSVNYILAVANVNTGSQIVAQSGTNCYSRTKSSGTSAWRSDIYIPFDCSKLIWDDSLSTNTKSSNRTVSDSTAYGGTSYNIMSSDISGFGSINFGNIDLPVGDYVAYIRCKVSGTSTDLNVQIIDNVIGYVAPLAYKRFTCSSSDWVYTSVNFTISDINIGNSIRAKIYRVLGDGAYIDFVLIVPTGLINKYVKRVMWNASPLTTELKSQRR